MLWCSSLLPIDSTVDSTTPITFSYNVAIDLVSCHTKQDLNRCVDDLPSFQGFQPYVYSGYSLCKNRLTCFKNEVSDVSCPMYMMY